MQKAVPEEAIPTKPEDKRLLMTIGISCHYHCAASAGKIRAQLAALGTLTAEQANECLRGSVGAKPEPDWRSACLRFECNMIHKCHAEWMEILKISVAIRGTGIELIWRADRAIKLWAK